MRTLRLPVEVLLVALMLGAVLAAGASATPVAKTVATVECQGASATLLMHPGEGGKAIWDISEESMQNAPSYLIKRIDGNVPDGLSPLAHNAQRLRTRSTPATLPRSTLTRHRSN